MDLDLITTDRTRDTLRLTIDRRQIPLPVITPPPEA